MKPHVLVAEADPDLAAALAGELAGGGAEVVSVGDGVSLISCLADKAPFDVVVADNDMPWMTALHLGRGATTPVVVLTRNGGAGVQTLRDLGRKVIGLAKPVELSELWAAIRKLVPAIAASTS